jgi:hypothetical protein
VVKAELRFLHSPDLDDLEHGGPADPEHFGILVQAVLGPVGGEGEESFDIIVCTPSWIGAEAARDGYAWGRHYLVVPRYDYAMLERAVTELCATAEGPDWQSVAAILARYGAWEFEDYEA